MQYEETVYKIQVAIILLH